MKNIQREEYFLIAFFLSLAYFPLVFSLRFLDDNAFTSWKWVFSGVDTGSIIILLVFAALLSFCLTRLYNLEKYPLILLPLLSLSLVIPGWDIPEVILDTSRYFIQAKYLKIYGIKFFAQEWGKTIQTWTDLPLVPFVYGLIFKFLGEVRILIQIWNTTMFSLTVIITYLLGKKLWNKEAGLLAGLCLLGIPYLATQVPLMLVDISTMFFFSFSVYCYILALEKGGLKLIFLAATIILFSMSAKFSIWPLLTIFPVISLIYFLGVDHKSTSSSQILSRSALVFSLCSLLFGLVFWSKYDIILNQIAFLQDYQWAGLKRWQESFLSTFVFQSHPFITIAAFYGLFCAIRKKEVSFIIPFCLVPLLFLLRLERIRYMIPLFPFFALMGGYGIYNIKGIKTKKYIAFFIVFSSFVLVQTSYFPFLRKNSFANLQKAGTYLDQLNCPRFMIKTKPQKKSIGNTVITLPILDLFTSKEIIHSPYAITADKQKYDQTSLRFTWEYDLPIFYKNIPQDQSLPWLIISDENYPEKTLTDLSGVPSNHVLKRYNDFSGIFRFRTLVSIFGNNCKVES